MKSLLSLKKKNNNKNMTKKMLLVSEILNRKCELSEPNRIEPWVLNLFEARSDRNRIKSLSKKQNLALPSFLACFDRWVERENKVRFELVWSVLNCNYWSTVFSWSGDSILRYQSFNLIWKKLSIVLVARGGTLNLCFFFFNLKNSWDDGRTNKRSFTTSLWRVQNSC